ncbi:hypothetical protein ACQ1Q5_01085 [Ornithobacterium rhinotracheale]
MKKFTFIPCLLFINFVFAQSIESISLSYDLGYNHKKIGDRYITFSLKNNSICVENFLQTNSYHFVKRTKIQDRMYWDAYDIQQSDKSLEENQKIIINKVLSKKEQPKENFKKEFLQKLKKIDWTQEKVNNFSDPLISIVVKFSNGDKKEYQSREEHSSREFIDFINYAKAFADWRLYKVYKTTPIQINYFRKFETKECF